MAKYVQNIGSLSYVILRSPFSQISYSPLIVSARQQNAEREEQDNLPSQGERLVRVPVEDLQSSTDKESS